MWIRFAPGWHLNADYDLHRPGRIFGEDTTLSELPNGSIRRTKFRIRTAALRAWLGARRLAVIRSGALSEPCACGSS